MHPRNWWAVASALLLAVSVAGCSKGPRPVKVKGYVSFDGQPMVGAQVTFVAQDKSGRDAHGYSGPDGAFQLSTFAPNDGALPGDYKVVVEYIPPAEAGPAT